MKARVVGVWVAAAVLFLAGSGLCARAAQWAGGPWRPALTLSAVALLICGGLCTGQAIGYWRWLR